LQWRVTVDGAREDSVAVAVEGSEAGAWKDPAAVAGIE